MKKFSFYNRIFDINGLGILYNVASDHILMLDPALCDLLEEHEAQPERLSDIHPELYAQLLSKGMLVDEGEEEYLRVIDQWRQEDQSATQARITVNPTLQCNLRCWYCYENHRADTVMSPQTQEAVKRLMDRTTADERLQSVLLDFFGGEPFLQYEACIRPLTAYMARLCKERGKEFHLSFTTNGVLVTPQALEFLRSLEEPAISFQITLDGNRRFHDSVRNGPDCEHTYDCILQHIRDILASGFQVFVRFNYTEQNCSSFTDVLGDFKDIVQAYPRKIDFNFHKVWQTKQKAHVEDTIRQNMEWFKEMGGKVNAPVKYVKGRCYADSECNIVVNYDGNLFKCTARDFTPENSDGILNEDGTPTWNERYARRMSIKYGNDVCHRCAIFPICHGGCSQDKLETGGANRCIRQYSEDEKEEIIEQRLLMLLENAEIDK